MQACVQVDETRRSVLVGRQRAFAFDHAFGQQASQGAIYEVGNRMLGGGRGCWAVQSGYGMHA